MAQVLLHPLFVTRMRENISRNQISAIEVLDEVIAALSKGKSEPGIARLISDCERARDVLASFDPEAPGADGELSVAKTLMQRAAEAIAQMQASQLS